MTPEEFTTAVQTNYPSIWNMLNKPGVYDMMWQALTGDTPWNSAQITQALHQTPYWQQTSDTERQWDALVAIDPKSAQERSWDMQTQVKNAASKLGVTLDWDGGDAASGWAFTAAALRRGWSAGDIATHLSQDSAQFGFKYNQTGDIQAGKQSAIKLASEYGVPLSDGAAGQWGLGLAAGSVDQPALQAYFVEQAKSMYPGLSSALDAGITTRQYADPYAQVAAKELGINPSDFNLSDPKWAKPLQQLTKDGDRTAMTLDQWQRTVRSDPTYGYDTTSGAQSQAAQFSAQLLQKFGATG